MFPTLYGDASNGKVKEWTIQVIQSDDSPVILRTHGYIDGKKTESRKVISEGKNKGKSNETTPYEQACSEAKSLWTKQVAKGYKEEIEDTSRVMLPTLAHDFNKREKDIHFPCWVQPKLDGVRCMAHSENGNVIFTSRTGKVFENLVHLRDMHIPPGVYLDGELYSDVLTFDEISGLTRQTKTQSQKEKHLEFHLFDAYDTNKTNLQTEERLEMVKKYSTCHNVKIVPTLLASTKELAMHFYQNFMNEGYEGIMFRNKSATYVPQYRSKHLQKYKEFKDDEFEIVGGKEAEGEDRGTVIFECKSDAGSFWVRPRGTREYRKRLFNELPRTIGKKLTVRFQNLTEYGEPRFPVGIAIRDYE